jgi:L-alanine-DL-glutamate epimerase-like enolase superfamily enzyme
VWDAKGKILNQPVFKLLGGRTKPKIPVYASRLYSQPLDTLYSEAKAYAEQGFKPVKLRFGWGPKDGLEGLNKNVDLVRTTREAVGDTIDIMADAYMGWNVEYAKRMLRMLAPYNMRWVEEPVVSDDLRGYAELRALNLVNISGGEHEYTIHGFRDAIALKAFDIAQPDINRVGGITAAKKIADMCEANDILFIPHAGQMHNYHVTMSSYAAPISEYFPQVPVEVGNELFWYIFCRRQARLRPDAEAGRQQFQADEVMALFASVTHHVIPTQAGIQEPLARGALPRIPAFAGMTEWVGKT